MDQTLTIRPMALSDLPAVAALARALAASVDDPDPGLDTTDLTAMFFGAAAWAECLVAVEAESVVGFVAFCRRFECHTRQRALWIGDLVSAADKRGQGIGSALLRAVQARGRELGCAAVMLEVWTENHRAQALYTRLGARLLDDRNLLVFDLDARELRPAR